MRSGVPADGTPLLRLVAAARRRQMVRLDAASAQTDLLAGLLRRAARTRFGEAHGFRALRGVAEFQRAVPLRGYEAMWEAWWQPGFPVLDDVTWPGRIPWFALSSGTTSGTTKRIPVSREAVRANRGAALDTLAWHLAADPEARPFGGLSFMLGGSTELAELAPGIRAGDLSGIAAAELPRAMRRWSWPPPELALLPDWSRKLARLVEETPAADIRTLTGTPSWLLVLLERLAGRHGTPPLPHLELLIHGGTAWGPYRDRLRPLLPPGCRTREVFPASEGFFAIQDGSVQDEAGGDGMRLVLDRGVFFEFVPVVELGRENPTRRWVEDVELGVDYALAVSTNAGLWAYLVGDVVRFVSLRPPRVVVVGRTAWTLSAFGEHVTGEELTLALARCGAAPGEWMVGAEFAGPLGRHRWFLEGAAAEPLALDAALCSLNDDYRAHREGGQMAPPEVEALPAGRFAEAMARLGRAGGQNKVPRVVADPARFAEWAAALRAAATGAAPGG